MVSKKSKGKTFKMTVSIPDKILEKFKKTFPEANVAEVARQIILDKLKELRKFKELKAKGVI